MKLTSVAGQEKKYIKDIVEKKGKTGPMAIVYLETTFTNQMRQLVGTWRQYLITRFRQS